MPNNINWKLIVNENGKIYAQNDDSFIYDLEIRKTIKDNNLQFDISITCAPQTPDHQNFSLEMREADFPFKHLTNLSYSGPDEKRARQFLDIVNKYAPLSNIGELAYQKLALPVMTTTAKMAKQLASSNDNNASPELTLIEQAYQCVTADLDPNFKRLSQRDAPKEIDVFSEDELDQLANQTIGYYNNSDDSDDSDEEKVLTPSMSPKR